MLILVLGTALTFSSCSSGDDDDDLQKGNDETTQKKDEGKDNTDNTDNTDNQNESVWGKGTWYFLNSQIQWYPLKKSSFDSLEKLIEDDEVLYQQYGCNDFEFSFIVGRDRVTRESYIDSMLGFFHFGDFWGTNAVRIVDDSTIVLCDFNSFVDEDIDNYNHRDYKKVVTLFRGKIYKSVSLYVKEEYRTYVKQGNKLMLTNGDVFTDTGEGLILDGESELRVVKDPAKLFEVK